MIIKNIYNSNFSYVILNSKYVLVSWKRKVTSRFLKTTYGYTGVA